MDDKAVGLKAERALARYCMTEPEWDSNAAIAQHGGERIGAVHQRLHESLVSLKLLEPTLDGEKSKEVRDSLKVLGAKVRPDMSSEQTTAWLNSVLIALSDMPARALQSAALDVIHVPFQYLNEVEAKMRDFAGREVTKIRIGIRRLEMMQETLIRQRSGEKRITDERSEPLSDAEVHNLQRSRLGRDLIRLGIAAGFIKPEQLKPAEEVMKEDGYEG